MAINDGIQTVDSNFVDGGPFPPRAYNDFVARSGEWSAAFAREHHDFEANPGLVNQHGRHQALRIAQGAGVINGSSGIGTPLDGAPTLNVVWYGTGGLFIVNLIGLPVFLGPDNWGIVAEASNSDRTQPPLVVERTFFGGFTKTADTTLVECFRFDGKDWVSTRPDRLIVHAYGTRGRL